MAATKVRLRKLTDEGGIIPNNIEKPRQEVSVYPCARIIFSYRKYRSWGKWDAK
jgi:hypothetical protein